MFYPLFTMLVLMNEATLQVAGMKNNSSCIMSRKKLPGHRSA
jgi:hypothetical protein